MESVGTPRCNERVNVDESMIGQLTFGFPKWRSVLALRESVPANLS